LVARVLHQASGRASLTFSGPSRLQRGFRSARLISCSKKPEAVHNNAGVPTQGFFRLAKVQFSSLATMLRFVSSIGDVERLPRLRAGNVALFGIRNIEFDAPGLAAKVIRGHIVNGHLYPSILMAFKVPVGDLLHLYKRGDDAQWVATNIVRLLKLDVRWLENLLLSDPPTFLQGPQRVRLYRSFLLKTLILIDYLCLAQVDWQNVEIYYPEYQQERFRLAEDLVTDGELDICLKEIGLHISLPSSIAPGEQIKQHVLAG